MSAQAEIYADAELSPGKDHFQREFLHRAGYSDEQWEVVASWRMVDPAGDVGMETFIVQLQRTGQFVQIPLTYRPESLDPEPQAPEPHARDTGLLGTMQHSVLGERWIYDGRQDPTYRECLTRTCADQAPAATQKIVATGEVKPSPVELSSTPGADGELLPEVELRDGAGQEPGTIYGTWGDGADRRTRLLAQHSS